MGASTCRSLAAPTRGVGTAGLTMVTRKAGELLTWEQEKELKSSLEAARGHKVFMSSKGNGLFDSRLGKKTELKFSAYLH